MFKTVKVLVLLMALFASLSVSVSAQTSGSILGEIRDEKQAIIPKATVTLRNVQTNDSRTTVSDDEGRYRFNSAHGIPFDAGYLYQSANRVAG